MGDSQNTLTHTSAHTHVHVTNHIKTDSTPTCILAHAHTSAHAHTHTRNAQSRTRASDIAPAHTPGEQFSKTCLFASLKKCFGEKKTNAANPSSTAPPPPGAKRPHPTPRVALPMSQLDPTRNKYLPKQCSDPQTYPQCRVCSSPPRLTLAPPPSHPFHPLPRSPLHRIPPPPPTPTLTPAPRPADSEIIGWRGVEGGGRGRRRLCVPDVGPSTLPTRPKPYPKHDPNPSRALPETPPEPSSKPSLNYLQTLLDYL